MQKVAVTAGGVLGAFGQSSHYVKTTGVNRRGRCSGCFISGWCLHWLQRSRKTRQMLVTLWSVLQGALLPTLTHRYKLFPLTRLNLAGQRHRGEFCAYAVWAQPVGGDLEDSPSASCLAMRSCSSRTFFSSSSTRRSSAAMGFRCSGQEDTSDCLRVQVPGVTSCSTTPHSSS